MKQRNNIATFHGWHGNLSRVTPNSSSRTAFGDECPLPFPPYSLLEAVSHTKTNLYDPRN